MARRTSRSRRPAALGTLLAGVLLACGCSDAHLYGKGLDDTSANRLGLTGQVCTDDPREAGFPVKVIFLVDIAAGPMFSDFDVELQRLGAIRDVLSLHGGNEAFEFAVIGFAASGVLLAPAEGYFTRNPGELESGVSMLSLSSGCVEGTCRDYADGLELARSLIEGDMTDMEAGERGRTQYVIVLIGGGPPDPLNCEYDCCDPADDECDTEECVPSWDCTTTLLRDTVAAVRDDVEDAGALSLSLHALQLAARDTTEADPDATLDATENLLEELAFAGAGSFQRVDVADSISLDKVGLLKISSLLEAKALIATNMSTLPGPDKPVVDSDGDGLGDPAEDSMGTSKTSADSDGDGLGDLLETLVSLDPLVADEPPGVCADLETPWPDRDLDRLNDCEEALLGTDPTLPDTDGDALTDWMEVLVGTDYLHADDLDDYDWDGTTNGDEARNHTDPRSSDASSHLSTAYRYDVTDEGILSEPSISTPRTIAGVAPLTAGSDTTGGLGTLTYDPGPPAVLSWTDASDSAPGPGVRVDAGGTIDLPSSSVDAGGYERWLRVDVTPSLLPPTAAEEQLLVELSERHCLTYTIRNIRLVETEAASGDGGINDVFLYFAEAPEGRMTLPGLFRAVHIPVEYHPETGRSPSDPLVTVNDEEFASIGY